MGYLKDGRWVETEDWSNHFQREIDAETMRLYREQYDGRNPDTLSSWELDQVRTKAGINIQERRRGRLVE